MSKLDKAQQICNDYRARFQNYEEVRPRPIGKKRTRIISISDLHIPFCRMDLLKEIISKHSGAEFIVVNGDLFDCHLISSFNKDREIPFIVEYVAALEVIRELSSNFEKVILVDGNHDAGRFNREMGKLNTSIQFLVRTSPMKYLAEGRRFSVSGEELESINLPNVIYAGEQNVGGWWFRVGKALFVHRLRGFKKAPMGNATQIADWFINRGTNFQCLVSAHSHKVGLVPYRGGRLVIDQGALCYPMDYESDGSCNYSPVDLGYAIVEVDQSGNVDPETTRPVYLGTYQEP